jgi:hypothetical protein
MQWVGVGVNVYELDVPKSNAWFLSWMWGWTELGKKLFFGGDKHKASS